MKINKFIFVAGVGYEDLDFQSFSIIFFKSQLSILINLIYHFAGNFVSGLNLQTKLNGRN